MTLAELCAPVFDTLCRLHRLARRGASLELTQVRQQIEKTFTHIHEQALGNQQLADQFSKVELPLMFFVDYLIKEGPFPFRDQWQELAYQKNELAGDEKFFDMLEETLADPSDAATERLKIYFTCMALGFNGCYASQPAQVERRVKVCALRIGVSPDTAFSELLPDESRRNVDAHCRFVRPTRGMGAVLVASVLILAAVVFVNVRTYTAATAALKADLRMTCQQAARMKGRGPGLSETPASSAAKTSTSQPANLPHPSSGDRANGVNR